MASAIDIKPLSQSGQALEALLRERIVLLDGAMGTMIQQHKLEEKDFRDESLIDVKGELKGNNDLLSLTRPDIIEEIHRQYFEAGSDIAETNTFSGTTIAQADYNLQHRVRDINIAAAKLAKRAAEEVSEKQGRRLWVAGAMGLWKDQRGVTAAQVANAKLQGANRNATSAEVQTTRKQLLALHKHQLLTKQKVSNADYFSIRG